MFERLKELCSSKGITLTELEREMKFGKGTIFKWTDSFPTVDKLQKVAEYFSVTMDYLMTGNL